MSRAWPSETPRLGMAFPGAMDCGITIQRTISSGVLGTIPAIILRSAIPASDGPTLPFAERIPGIAVETGPELETEPLTEPESALPPEPDSESLPDLTLAVPADQLPWKVDHRQHALAALPVTFNPQPTE